MGKSAKTKQKSKTVPSHHLQQRKPLTTADIKEDPSLGYKIRVLLFDMRNVKNEPASVSRLNDTIDMHYISTPYVSTDEAEAIKTALVDAGTLGAVLQDIATARDEEDGEQGEGDGGQGDKAAIDSSLQLTVQAALEARFASFLEKRKASGDARPCGPHGLAPFYQLLFGISKEELEGEKFVRRVKRLGLRSD